MIPLEAALDLLRSRVSEQGKAQPKIISSTFGAILARVIRDARYVNNDEVPNMSPAASSRIMFNGLFKDSIKIFKSSQ